VYTTLAATVLLSAVGVYIHTLLNIGGIITSLLFIGASTWLAVTPATIQNEVCSSLDFFAISIHRFKCSKLSIAHRFRV